MKPTLSNELLDPVGSSHSILRLEGLVSKASAVKKQKPIITKPVTQSSNSELITSIVESSRKLTNTVRSRLNTFLPDLKAANEALPQDSSELDIEKLHDTDQYIEMDLGLGVLEEKRGEDSSEDSDSSDTRDVLSTLMKRKHLAQSGITEVAAERAFPAESGLLCDESLKRFRAQCLSGAEFEMDIVLSLMSRILLQLRKRTINSDVMTITKLNVLQEDMYKLMSRRDRLIESDEGRLKHESLYLEELDQLIKEP